MDDSRRVDVVLLMGPPGKSFLGNQLNARGVISHTELEPVLKGIFGSGEDFVSRRSEAHAWIRNFYCEQLAGAILLIGIETTGIGDRPFLEELSRSHRMLFVKVTTPREVCVERVRTRPGGRNINAPFNAQIDLDGSFYDYWHGEIAPTYEFDLSVPGTDVASAAGQIQQAIEQT